MALPPPGLKSGWLSDLYYLSLISNKKSQRHLKLQLCSQFIFFFKKMPCLKKLNLIFKIIISPPHHHHPCPEAQPFALYLCALGEEPEMGWCSSPGFFGGSSSPTCSIDSLFISQLRLTVGTIIADYSPDPRRPEKYLSTSPMSRSRFFNSSV